MPAYECDSPEILDTKEMKIKELNELYRDRNCKIGLRSLSKDLSVDLKAKDKRTKVLIIGNQSSGKSQFVNWYVGGIVQQTGEQIDTTKFTLIRFVTINHDTEIGLNALSYWPEIEKLKESESFLDYFETKFTVFNSHDSKLVDLIDTPGLSDDLYCNYKEEEIILELVDKCDLVLVFLDEHVVLSCNKTREIIIKLNEKYKEKMIYCLTKVDLLNRNELVNCSVRLGSSLSSLSVNIDKVYSLSIPKPYETEKINNSSDLNEICSKIENLVNNKINKYEERVGEDINEIGLEIEKRINDSKRYKDFKYKEFMLFVLNMIFVHIMLYLLYQEDKVNLPGINQIHFSMKGLNEFERIILYISAIIIAICMFMAYRISNEEKKLKEKTPYDISYYEKRKEILDKRRINYYYITHNNETDE